MFPAHSCSAYHFSSCMEMGSDMEPPVRHPEAENKFLWVPGIPVISLETARPPSGIET
jgi:hypothetical protein